MVSAGEPVLSRRALNRATMARQLLLARSDRPLVDAVGHLVGLQAQVPDDPYLGLWSRLTDFDPLAMGQAMEDRQLVRIVAMRGTIHLLTADDALLLRPLSQPVLDGELRRHREHSPALRDVELAPVLAFATTLLADAPRSGPELRAALAERFPDHDPAALAYACRNHLALVQVPPRGVWGKRGQVTVTTAQTWLGRPLADRPSIDEVIPRYLRAFGPATAADVASWSRLTAIGEVLERLRPSLRTFRDERGRQLFDVPDGLLPDQDTPAPARVFPEYDNAFLSHADRSRYTPDERIAVDPPIQGTVTSDGFLAGVWALDRSADAVTMTVRHRPLAPGAVDELASEAERALTFLAPTATAREVVTQQT